MSLPSDPAAPASGRRAGRVVHVIVGPGDDPTVRELLTAPGETPPDVLRLPGAPGDGRTLLEVIAGSERVVYSAWPAGAW